MSYNVFTKPTDAFKEAIERPNVLKGVVIVILAGILLSIMGYLATGLVSIAPIIILVNIIQWLVLAIVLWFFEFMLAPKKKGFKATGIGMREILTMTGKQWLIILVAGIIFIIGLFGMSNRIVVMIMLIIIAVLIVIWFISLYKMVKVTLECTTGKAIVAWILLIILQSLLTGFVLNLISLPISLI